MNRINLFAFCLLFLHISAVEEETHHHQEHIDLSGHHSTTYTNVEGLDNPNIVNEELDSLIHKKMLNLMEADGKVFDEAKSFGDCGAKGTMVRYNSSIPSGILYFEQIAGTSHDNQVKMYCYHLAPVLCTKKINYDRPPYYVKLPSIPYAWNTNIVVNAPYWIRGCDIMNMYHVIAICKETLGNEWEVATSWEGLITHKFTDGMEDNEEYGPAWGNENHKYRRFTNWYAYANLNIVNPLYYVMGDKGKNCWWDDYGEEHDYVAQITQPYERQYV